MNFHEFGDPSCPSIVMIHGGGNAWWNYLRQARALAQRYHVILPTLDGHGEMYATPYVSTEKSADELLAYIDERCGGRVFALCGVSLGGQVVIEMLSRRADLAEKAIIDGSLCYPKPVMAWLCMGAVAVCGSLLFSEKACRRQLALMPKLLPAAMQFPEEIRAYYLQDMPRLPRRTLYTMYRTYMGYRLKESLRNSHARVMYWYGEKEMRCVKKSARRFATLHPACRLYEAKGCNHGYLAIYLPEEWMKVAVPFLEE